MGDWIYAVRTLLKNAGFTSVAVTTLALGVGANTAIFSVVKAVLLNQLPYSEPGRLVSIAESDAAKVHPQTVDYTTTYDLRTRSRSFEKMSLYRDAAGAIAENGEPELLRGLRVNYDFLDTLGIKVALGRTFVPEEDQPTTRFEVILSHGLWVRRFGADPNVIGRVVHLSEAPVKVVGVLPENFQPLNLNGAGSGTKDTPEIFLPLGYTLAGASSCRGCQHLRLIGRLKPGVTPGVARAELNTIMRDIVREHPGSYAHDTSVRLESLQDAMVGRVQTPLWILLGAVGFVLLIACANVANLTLARATGRVKEMALRAALGAGRWRLIRQLLVESVALSVVGGAAGIMLAAWGVAMLARLGPSEIPRVHEIRIDGAILLFSLAISLLTGILFGLVPALRASQVDLNDAVKGSGKATEGRSRQGLRNMLVATEIALAFVLVVGAGLLGRSYLHLMNVNPGYDPHNLLTLNTYVYGSRYQQKPQAELSFYSQVKQILRSTPGVENVAMVSTLPLASFDRRGFQIQDRRLANEAEAPSADAYSVSPEYFQVMRIPITRGRSFNDRDVMGSSPVAIISESCARTQFRDQDPIGKHIQLGGRADDKPWLTIVGVSGDVHQYGLDKTANIAAYIAQAQDVSFNYTMVIRTSIDPRRLERTVRDAFLAVDKTQPIFDVKPFETYLAATLAERTFTLALLALFGTLALALAAVGIYGVISYAVTLRTRELGIRMALGAERSEVLAMVLRQGATITGAGLSAGFLASLALTRLLTSMLFEVRPADLLTSLLVGVILAVVALVAIYVPARRAAGVDPMVALRYE